MDLESRLNEPLGFDRNENIDLVLDLNPVKLCEYTDVHFHVLAGDNIANANKLWIKGKQECSFSISKKTTFSELYTIFAENFGVSRSDFHEIKIAGQRSALPKTSSLRLENFQIFFDAYRDQSKIVCSFDEVDEVKKPIQLKDVQIVYPKVTKHQPFLSVAGQLKNLLETLEENTIKATNVDTAIITQLTNAIYGICSGIQLPSVTRILEFLTQDNKNSELVSSLYNELKTLVSVYTATIERSLPQDTVKKSSHNAKSNPSIPLSLKIESIHSFEQNISRITLEIRLQKGLKSTSNDHSFIQTADVVYSDMFSCAEINSAIDFPAIIELLPTDACLWFEISSISDPSDKRTIATGIFELFDRRDSLKFNAGIQLVPLKSSTKPDIFLENYFVIIKLPEVTIYPIESKEVDFTDFSFEYHPEAAYLRSEFYFNAPSTISVWSNFIHAVKKGDPVLIEYLPITFMNCSNWTQNDTYLMLEVLKNVDFKSVKNIPSFCLGIMSINDGLLNNFVCTNAMKYWSEADFIRLSSFLIQIAMNSIGIDFSVFLLRVSLQIYPSLQLRFLYLLENLIRRKSISRNLQLMHTVLLFNSEKAEMFKNDIKDYDKLFFIANQIRFVNSKQSTLQRLLEETCMTANAQLSVHEYSDLDTNEYTIDASGFTVVEKTQQISTSVKKIRNPFHPFLKPASILAEKCKIFNSNALPVLITLCHESDITTKILLKSSPHLDKSATEDVSQDAFICEMICEFDRVWLDNDLDLKTVVYSCLPLGADNGLVQIAGNGVAKSLREIQGGATGTLFEQSIFKWLDSRDTKVVNNFVRSTAGCCLVSYVLGLGDRHNDNILLTRDGRLFHVDFGNAFGRWKKFAGVSRDKAPFMLSKDIVYMLTKNGRFNDFLEYLQRGYFNFCKYFEKNFQYSKSFFIKFLFSSTPKR